jgi:hypothetical protein
MLPPAYVTCEECGGIYAEGGKHECDPDTLVRFQAAKFEKERDAYLRSPRGQFDQYYASRQSRGS